MTLPLPTPETLSATLQALERWEASTLTPLQWNERFLPIHFPGSPAPFHLWLSEQLSAFHVKRGSRLALIAPRESAKSTTITLAHVLRCALEGRESYTLILGKTQPRAEQFLQGIRDELTENPLIERVYGTVQPQRSKKTKDAKSTSWNRSDVIRLANGCQIQAIGRGCPIRGLKKRADRPTLIVIDDVQELDDVGSDAVRTGTLDWFLSAVINCGSAITNFISVGSALHRECLAVKLQTLPGWQARTFAAMLSWPERMDLWQECERLATNLADDDRATTAERFIAAHLKEMERGGRTYWPIERPVSRLMRQRCEIGRQRFQVEYQGIPGTLPGAEWPAEYFDWPGFWFEEWPRDLVRKVIALDPSKSSESKVGDYQAHALVGLARNGDLYVDCDLRHDPPGEMCLRTCLLARDWIRLDKRGIDAVFLEDNATMGLLEVAMAEATRETGLVLPWECITQREPKDSRIRVVDPYLRTRRVRVRNTPGGRLLVDQWRDFPQGANDDGPDATATAVRGLEIMQGEAE